MCDLLYRNQSAVKIGQVERYIITYKPPQKQHVSKDGKSYSSVDQSSLFLRVRNCESLTKRAAYLMGPYILYLDVRPMEYDHKMPCYISADQPQFEPNLQPGQMFSVELSCHTIKEKYIWVVDVASQMLFSSKTKVEFEISIGRSESALSMKTPEKGILDGSNINVVRFDTDDLWNFPAPVSSKPVHLVVLTHGLHSNVGADMLYIKDQIEQAAAQNGQNVIVRGYQDNVCKTERGIKYLGMKVAEYIVNEIYENVANIKSISFIAHSLGGLIQTFAIAYIENNFPWFFKNVSPVNFITLASPLLGISHIDSPGYVQAALSFGAIGRTGQELSLIPTEIDGKKTLLELLPTGTTHKILKRFKRRTVYANAVNDGIVPLRTSALLFLDYKGLRKVAQVVKSGHALEKYFAGNLLPKLSAVAKNIYNIPEFMNSMPFVYSSDPLTSLSSETASVKVSLQAHDPVLQLLDSKGSAEVNSHNASVENYNKNDSATIDIKNGNKNNTSIANEITTNKDISSNSANRETSNKSTTNENNIDKTHVPTNSNTHTEFDNVKPVNSEIGEIPSSKQGPYFQSFFLPIQNALASWVAPQGSKSKTNDDNPLPKASVIESARSILLPPLPPKQYLIEPNDRGNPVLHDKVYDNNDISIFKSERRKREKSANIDTDDTINNQDSALSPFADNFASFFASSSRTERLEEKIAMAWHDGMTWRKVLVFVKPDAHNNIIVRRRFSNAYGWLVIDHLVANHFNCKSEDTDDDGLVPVSEEEYIRHTKDSTFSQELEVPEFSHFKQSPRLGRNLFQELDSILGKDTLMRENTAYNYSPNLENIENYPQVRQESQDWINIKNYNEDSLFEIGPTGFLSNVNDKISKII